MSTDLEFSVKLPKLRLPTNTIQAPTAILPEYRIEEECRTPTSEEHKIPAILSCPPAPRKARKVNSFKRKLIELEFFEMVNKEEVEDFFRPRFETAEIMSFMTTKRSKVRV